MITLLMLGSIVNYLTRSTLSVAAPTMKTELGISEQEVRGELLALLDDVDARQVGPAKATPARQEGKSEPATPVKAAVKKPTAKKGR